LHDPAPWAAPPSSASWSASYVGVTTITFANTSACLPTAVQAGDTRVRSGCSRWTICFLVTVGVSLATRPKPVEELVGLVYSATPRPAETRRLGFASPAVLALVVLAGALALNLWFW
jgi:hypothetical protein